MPITNRFPHTVMHTELVALMGGLVHLQNAGIKHDPVTSDSGLCKLDSGGEREFQTLE